jgi:glutamate/tyrosine decarboxylase-like PLP-dependent enzyme
MIKALGRSGVGDLIERCCGLARLFADRLVAEPGIRVAKEVWINQFVVVFRDH